MCSWLAATGFLLQEAECCGDQVQHLDRELLACVAAIWHFWCLVEGRAFTLYTYHKPLTYLLSKQADAWSARQQCHLAYVAEYTADIQHVQGVENVVADALSRPKLWCRLPLQGCSIGLS